MSVFENEIAGLSPKRLALLCLELKGQLDGLRSARPEPIAIIGMGCRFPGGAHTPEEFWRLLEGGVDAVCDLPPGRWDSDAYYDPNPAAPGKMYTRQGGFLKEIDGFDAEFFGISPREVKNMDPQHRLLLEVGWEALEHAGQSADRLAGTQTGVFVGIGIDDYAKLQLKTLPASSIDAYTGTGNAFCFASGRLSYLLGLHGPSIAMDTACSTSLVTIHLACQSLRSKECSLALAGGVNLMLAPEPTIFLSKAQALSPDGRCKTFDASADGYGRGEGCGMVVLKRLSDALADGDNVYAVIRGSAVNHDGQSSGLTVPNGQAQQAVIREALARAGVAPHEVNYVEAHGTGTALGDPTEVRALGAVMGRNRAPGQPLWVGSVKTNIGHLEVAAGVASVIKVALALQHRTIPPHLHFQCSNPHLSLDDIPARIPTSCVPWSAGPTPRIAGVSSFGLSGTNAHLVLEEAPAGRTGSGADRPVSHRPQLLALSARDPWSLRALVSAYTAALAEGGSLREAALADICFTAGVRRSHHRHRWAAVVSSIDDLRRKLTDAGGDSASAAKLPAQRKLVFVFNGQGPEWRTLGRELMGQEPGFLAVLKECDEIFRRHGGKSVLDELQSRAAQTEITSPALFALQVALARQWESWGVRPDAVVGHGFGEVAAGYVAGILNFEEAVQLALRPTLSGFKPRAAVVPMFSTVDGKEGEGAAFEPGRNLMRPVLLATALRSLIAEGHEVFLEIGPRSLLSPTMTESLKRAGREGSVLCSLGTDGGESTAMLDSLAALYMHGWSVEFSALHPVGGRVARLPFYPWHRRRHWIDPEASNAQNKVAADSPLMGQRLHSPAISGDGADFQVRLRADSRPFLADHCIHGAVLMPATGYLEMSLSAGLAILGSGSMSLEDVSIQNALVLDADEEREVHTVLRRTGPGAATFQICSLKSGAAEEAAGWITHTTGTLRLSSDKRAGSPISLQELSARYTTEMAVDDFYERLRARGFEFGPGFRGIRKILSAPGAALGRVELPESLRAGLGAYWIHPALLDACFHLVAATFSASEQAAEQHGFLPVGLRRLHLYRRPGTELWCEASRLPAAGSDPDSVSSDLRLYDAEGNLVAEIEGLWFRRLTEDSLRGLEKTQLRNLLYELRWRPVERAPRAASARPPGAWLVFADRGDIGPSLARVLQARGETCVLVRPAADGDAAGGDGLAIDADSAEDYLTLFQQVRTEHPHCHGILYLWGLDATTDDKRLSQEVGDGGCRGLLHVIQALGAAGWKTQPGLCVVTRGCRPVLAQSEPLAVAQAPLWGLTQVIALEKPDIACVSIDLDPVPRPEEILQLVDEIDFPSDESQIGLRGGLRYAPRIHRRPALSVKQLAIPAGESFRLESPDRGVLDRLVLRSVLRRAPGRGEVEIRVQATGLNFKDVLNVLGMYPGDAGPLGSECAGQVVAVGAGVTGLREGDEVIGFAPGSFSKYVTTTADFVVRKPGGLSFEEGATIPITFVTAGYALRHLARLASGERVLLHAAAGGVGMAAVQLAQQAGAEIFATAGSPQKRRLLRSLGIRHVMDSRSLDFVGEVRRITGGGGVDVVLNSLAGEFPRASLSLLNPGGRFVEIGKIDILNEQEVARLRPDVSYHVIALDHLNAEESLVVRSLLQELSQDFGRGRLKPLPRRVFPLEQAAEAFRFMAQAKHTGKVVVSQVSPRPAAGSLKPDATYLITGGLGALGLQLARGMFEQGARHLVLMGRSAPGEAAGEVVRQLRKDGAQITVARGDVARREEIARVIDDIRKTMPALQGIVHAAGILEDGMLEQQSWDRFAAVFPAKVQGAWNLHALTEPMSLDFFILFSSVASVFGSPGQGNYAAANAFLDALAYHRRAIGLPALTVNWGPWSGAGFAAAAGSRGQERWAAQGIGVFSGRQGLDLFAQILGDDATQAIAFSVEWPKFMRHFPRGERTPLFAEMSRQDAVAYQKSEYEDVLRRIREARPREARELLRDFLSDQVARLLGFEPGYAVDTGQGLLEMGMDSLMAVDLRNRLFTALGRSLPPTVVFDHPTIDALTTYLGREVLELPDPAEAASVEGGGDLEKVLKQLEQLSDEEAEANLAARLKKGAG
jgi:acyl transferase domain-containing protein